MPDGDVLDAAPEAVSPSLLGRLKRYGIGLLLLVAATAGGGYYLHESGVIRLSFLPAPEDRNKPRLVPRDGHTGFMAGTAAQAAIDPRKFKASYYPIEESFTSNLGGSGRFVQIAIGVSTYYDQRVFGNLRAHEMAVRSAVLMTLSHQSPDQLATADGKRALQQELKRAINAVLTRKEGFGGIDDVYFTSFVMQ